MMMASNTSIVLRLIQKAAANQKTAARGMPGKKALQKSVYLFNLEHGYFNFKWADYGPFSAEVQQIAHDLAYCGKINIREIPTKKEGAVIQSMQYVKDFGTLENFPSDMDATLERIVGFIEGRKPRELELLASVHYLAQRQLQQAGTYDTESVHQLLSKLKPSAGFTLGDVGEALQALKAGGFSLDLE